MNMTRETKNLCLQGLQQLKGDDAHFARCAFRRMTPKEMEEPYGMSGKTRWQTLTEYEKHEREIQAAIDEINSL